MANIKNMGPGSVLTNTSNRWKRADGSTTFATGHVADLKDFLDSTRAVLSGSGTAVLKVDNESFAALDANERIARVRLYARILTPSGYSSTLKLYRSGTQLTSVSHPGTGNYFSRYSGWLTATDAGAEWTDTTVNQLEWEVSSSVGFTSLPEFVVQVDVRTRASVTASYPNNDELMGPKATFLWAYEGDGESQYRYQLKIFEAAVAEGGGFDPATSTNVHDETRTTDLNQADLTLADGSEDPLYVNPIGLIRGDTYYWSVRASKTINGAEWWSEWSPLGKFRYQQKPTASSVTPSGTVTTASRPAIGWVFNAVDSFVLPQGAYGVKIFKQPAGGWGTFNPGTLTSDGPNKPVAYTGTKNSYYQEGTWLTWQPSKPLDNNTTYRAYVKVRRGDPILHGTRAEWSDWAYSEFTINVTPPTAPTFSLTPDAANGRMNMSTTVTGTGTYDDYRMEIERSLDGGTTWSTIAPIYFNFFGIFSAANSERVVTFTTPGSTTWYDYTCPFNVAVTYRVRVIKIVTGQDFASNWVQATATVVTSKVWLKVLSDPTLSQTFPVMDDWISITRSLPRVVHRPLGRSRPVVMRGQPTGDSFQVKFLLLTQASFDTFMDRVTSGTKFLLQNESKFWYVEVSGDIEWEDHLWDTRHGEVEAQIATVPFVEVQP